jgi:divalent metal cation (Fe/Co/Zn/Cd) transporter
VGIASAHMFNAPRLDGVASIGIALVLLVSSLLLTRETKALLIGEPAVPHLREAILQIASADRGVHHANGVLTVQLGPRQIVAALSVEFQEPLSTTQIEHCVNRIETAIGQAFPDVVTLFVKPQSAETWRRRVKRLKAVPEDAPDD